MALQVPRNRHSFLHIPIYTECRLLLKGSGKSTVAALLERFYEPCDGQISIDGTPLNEMDPSWIRQQIGFINQEPVLFAASIADNIRYGNPDATDEEVRSAARKANAETFIEAFPDGYDTMVGERGTSLSGGQKQRVAIARAILKNPKVWTEISRMRSYLNDSISPS